MRTRALLASVILSEAALTLTVATAHATVYDSFTTFTWSGAQCVKTLSPEVGNYTALAWATVCADDGFHQINKMQVQSGQWIGVKIPLTGQTHVTCTAWLGPQGGLMSSYANDTADSSLGSGEADCLRQVP